MVRPVDQCILGKICSLLDRSIEMVRPVYLFRRKKTNNPTGLFLWSDRPIFEKIGKFQFLLDRSIEMVRPVDFTGFWKNCLKFRELFWKVFLGCLRTNNVPGILKWVYVSYRRILIPKWTFNCSGDRSGPSTASRWHSERTLDYKVSV